MIRAEPTQYLPGFAHGEIRHPAGMYHGNVRACPVFRREEPRALQNMLNLTGLVLIDFATQYANTVTKRRRGCMIDVHAAGYTMTAPPQCNLEHRESATPIERFSMSAPQKKRDVQKKTAALLPPFSC